MKSYLYLLLLFTTPAAFAQTKDTRAELNIQIEHNPIDSFLSYPIKSFSIHTENIGCEFNYSSWLDYTKSNNDSHF